MPAIVLPPPIPGMSDNLELMQWLNEIFKRNASLTDSDAVLGDTSDVTLTSITSGELLKWNGTIFINNTLAEAGISAATHNHTAAETTSGTFADARIAESNVTQHEAALAITESQITDLSTNKATTAQLVDVGNAINTDAAKILGYAVLNTTTGATVFASGDTDGADWHFYDSSVAHSPV